MGGDMQKTGIVVCTVMVIILTVFVTEDSLQAAESANLSRLFQLCGDQSACHVKADVLEQIRAQSQNLSYILKDDESDRLEVTIWQDRDLILLHVATTTYSSRISVFRGRVEQALLLGYVDFEGTRYGKPCIVRIGAHDFMVYSEGFSGTGTSLSTDQWWYLGKAFNSMEQVLSVSEQGYVSGWPTIPREFESARDIVTENGVPTGISYTYSATYWATVYVCEESEEADGEEFCWEEADDSDPIYQPSLHVVWRWDAESRKFIHDPVSSTATPEQAEGLYNAHYDQFVAANLHEFRRMAVDERLRRWLIRLAKECTHADNISALLEIVNGASSAALRAGSKQAVTVKGVTFNMVYIPAGEYLRGSPENEPGRTERESPQHRVRISKGFWIGETEVTQGLWQAVMGNNPSHFKACGSDCPVERVSWHDSQEFIKRLNGLVSGGGFRLPTEGEWEYAARAGTTGPFHTGNCLSTSQANYDGDYPLEGCPEGQYRRTTVPVSSFAANAWGLYDMHGNVWEWVQDWYGSYPSGLVTDPTGPSSGAYRVFRGGSWNDDARDCRSADRGRVAALGFRLDGLGLRLARTH